MFLVGGGGENRWVVSQAEVEKVARGWGQDSALVNDGGERNVGLVKQMSQAGMFLHRSWVEQWVRGITDALCEQVGV